MPLGGRPRSRCPLPTHAAGAPGPSHMGTGDDNPTMRRVAFVKVVVKPTNFRPISKPGKTNHFDRKKNGPTLPRIIPQKRTIKAIVRRADFMQDAIRKIAHTPTPRRKGNRSSQKVHKSTQKALGNLHKTHPPPLLPAHASLELNFATVASGPKARALRVQRPPRSKIGESFS